MWKITHYEKNIKFLQKILFSQICYFVALLQEIWGTK